MGETTWEKYLKEKKQNKKEKRSKVKETGPEGAAAGGRGVGEGENDVRFDDSFFQHDITTATAVSGRNSSCPSCVRLLRLLLLYL